MAYSKVQQRIRTAMWVMLVMTIGFARHARADAKANAEALYQEGMRLMQQGGAKDACPKLEESQKLDPALGTQFRLAECYEAVGKTALAWSQFREVASKARAQQLGPQAQKAEARAAALEPKLAKISIVVADEVTKLEGFAITHGDQTIGAGALGVPLPVDPGQQTIRVTAKGRMPWETQILAEPAQTKTIQVPALRNADADASPPAASTKPGSGLRTAAFVTGGVGIGALVVGAITGGMAFSRNGTWQNEVDANCNAEGACNASSILAIRDIEAERARFATTSTVTFVVGGALMATGVVLWLVAPSAKSASHAALVPVGPGAPGITLRISH